MMVFQWLQAFVEKSSVRPRINYKLYGWCFAAPLKHKSGQSNGDGKKCRPNILQERKLNAAEVRASLHRHHEPIRPIQVRAAEACLDRFLRKFFRPPKLTTTAQQVYVFVYLSLTLLIFMITWLLLMLSLFILLLMSFDHQDLMNNFKMNEYEARAYENTLPLALGVVVSLCACAAVNSVAAYRFFHSFLSRFSGGQLHDYYGLACHVHVLLYAATGILVTLSTIALWVFVYYISYFFGLTRYQIADKYAIDIGEARAIERFAPLTLVFALSIGSLGAFNSYVVIQFFATLLGFRKVDQDDSGEGPKPYKHLMDCIVNSEKSVDMHPRRLSSQLSVFKLPKKPLIQEPNKPADPVSICSK